jgi:redox-sensitive bicupin YhaK (pirin superfamily)
MYAGLFDGAERATFKPRPARSLYLHLAEGSLHVDDTLLNAGDAISSTDPSNFEIYGGAGAQLLLFDVPGVSGGA